MTRLASACLAVSALLAGCGRSGLRIDAGASAQTGAGGGPGAASSSQTGTGGIGGAEVGGGGAGGAAGAPGCTVNLPIAQLAGTGSMAQFEPKLVASSVDGQTVTVVTAWQVPEGPEDIPPPELRHTSFQPWTDWPADGMLGPTYLADYDGGGAFAGGPDPANLGLALFFRNELAPPTPEVGMYFMPGVIPGSGDVPAATLVAPQSSRAHFVVGDGFAEYLVGSGVQGIDSDATEVALVKKVVDGYYVQGPLPLGCSLDQGHAAAVRSGDRYLVGLSAGSDFDDPTCFAHPAEHVQVVRVESDGSASLGAELDAGPDSVAALRMVPTSDGGAWVVWSRFSGGGPPPVWIARVDAEGSPTFGPFETSVPEDPEWMGAVDMGGWLALAFYEHVKNAGDRLGVRVLDQYANVVAEGGIPLGTQGGSPISLLGGPPGTSLLVAWADGLGPELTTRVARFDCNLPGRL